MQLYWQKGSRTRFPVSSLFTVFVPDHITLFPRVSVSPFINEGSRTAKEGWMSICLQEILTHVLVNSGFPRAQHGNHDGALLSECGMRWTPPPWTEEEALT